MADEKTNPTPKVAPRDTMHSQGGPDRSKGEGNEDVPAPPNTSVGSEAPREQIVKSLDNKSGTLVERLLPPDSEMPEGSDEPVNPGNPAPEEPIALQPGEDPTTTHTSAPFGESGRQGKAKSASSGRGSRSKAAKADSAKVTTDASKTTDKATGLKDSSATAKVSDKS